MALPVLDGNQTATTLSSVVTGGEHIVAHSVVSLGSTAISNISSAVSGAVITIPAFAKIENSVATDGVLDGTANFIKIGGHQSGTNSTAHIVHVSNGGAMSVDATGSSVTFTQATVTFGQITGTITANLSSTNLNSVTIGVRGTVTASDSTAVSPSLPSTGYSGDPYPVGTKIIPIGGWTAEQDGAHWQALVLSENGDLFVHDTQLGYNTDASATSDTGTFSIFSLFKRLLSRITSLIPSNLTVTATRLLVDGSGVTQPVSGTFWQATQPVSLASVPTHGVTLASTTVTVSSLPSISGTVTANGGNFTGVEFQAQPPERAIQLGYYDSDNSEFVLVNQSGIPIQSINPLTIQGLDDGKVPISGTVTANSIYPKITFIDGSSSVVTANSAIQVFATSSTRSYLLVQVTTGSAYVNVGATATTANGIYLGTGQGYAWETTIPQGIVSLISSATGTAYCAKQA